MAPPPLSKAQMERLAAACQEYRTAFEAVERTLEEVADPTLPSWVYNLEDFDLEALEAAAPRVADAERCRRANRAALHAVIELVALDDDEGTLAAQPGGTPPAETIEALSSRAVDDLRWLRVLDRFISVVGRADDGGAQYVNGTFAAVVAHPTDPSDPSRGEEG